ncbi:precorrin-3B C(17)-methyltransferase [Phormidesmis priestleyi ULC007]|uniref:Precorrin-3B C(17)-methyltransferase n=1 Tax=Phormidesmis priestleyi ULC007 TaxID=1920490 RepID=A0A2T1DKL7_9CYAN|nr:precorrin-3B C(17)-methyltransferase [Phormidesmis priestleyi]PSB20991.1 precorrin-3B C(17)-methyltransferase [Phormidesmis priestleyi ULC007]PZO53673.1 MAG: precorrin-3B C(17)-methyltransferase [Phormidesmis priestleyi]
MNAPAVVVLGQASVAVARQLMSVLPDATLYGLAGRTTEVDVSFTDFGATLRELFATGTPIIGVCAAGILIRTIAPLLSNKRYEPPVLAVAEDGSAVVPLLGGLQGVNDLARQIAAVLNVQPAITTTGDIRFRTTLLNPPPGYHLANPDDAKTFISDLLAGSTVRLEGNAPWLSESKLPIAPDAPLTLQVTESKGCPASDRLVYHPATLAIAVSHLSDSELAIEFVQQILDESDLTIASIAGIFASNSEMGHPTLEALSQALQVPIRFLDLSSAEEIALNAAGELGQLIVSQHTSGLSCAIARAAQPIDVNLIGKPRGQLTIVGTGPGGEKWMSPEVKDVLRSATDWVGYKFYLDLAGSLREGQQRHDSDNREELDRARFALDLAATGKSVAVVSSGDPGIFAMAAAVFEVLEHDAKPEWLRLDIRVAPGISAMQAAAAQIGAPLGHDFCALSLSDILKPWSVIEQRIAAAAQADLVMAFYNPISKQRTWQLGKAREILLQWRSPNTPIVLARNLGRPGESVRVCTLEQFSPEDVDMRTVVLVGSSQTRSISRPHGDVWVYTPRRYE